MLQITKAREVVPMSLYLSGRFFHGGRVQLEPTSPELVPVPSRPSDFSNSPARSRGTTGPRLDPFLQHSPSL